MHLFAQSPADVIQVFSAALHDGRVEACVAVDGSVGRDKLHYLTRSRFAGSMTVACVCTSKRRSSAWFRASAS
jgi:hypothetical protein